ncbi:MAG: ester cyclase [Chitinophagaceae bacterium]|nr:ester cyclase [Chitinophagaceae bacterium]
MSTSELLSQWYDEVWNKSNDAFIDEMMSREVVVYGLDPSGSAKGVENFKVFYHKFRESFPTVSIKVTPLVSDHQTATAFCNVSARSATGKEVTFSGLCVARYFICFKIVEAWNNFDFLKMYQQLGHILVAQIEENTPNS